MSKMDEYKYLKGQLDAIQLQLVEEIKTLVSNIKDAKGIKRMGVGFTISSSMLKDCWSPAYFDNIYEAQNILNKIEKTNNFEVTLKILKNIVSTKHVDKNRINDDLVSQINNILQKYSVYKNKPF